jgi:hypothetical protein
MSYRNKTYVIFDGDDIKNYHLVLAWKSNQNIDFNFHDAHESRGIRTDSEEDSVKRGLRERFKNASQAIVLVGEHTRYLYKYVRWEIDVAQSLDLPIIVANLNGARRYEEVSCPPILRQKNAVFVSFSPKIIRYALDSFPTFYQTLVKSKDDDYHYPDKVYNDL